MPAESVYEDGEVAPPRGTRAPGSESEDDGLGPKRKHKKKDKDERALKRHKEHKTKEHKKDRKHKKEKEEKENEDSDLEKEKTNGASSKGLVNEDRQRDISPKKLEEDRPPAKERSPQQRPREAGRSRSPPRRRSRSNERRRTPPRGRSPPRRAGYGRSPPRNRYGSAGYDRNRGGNDRYSRDNRGGRRGDDRRDDRRQITEERRQDELKREKERDEEWAALKKKEDEEYAAKVAAQFESMQEEGAFDDDGIIVIEDDEDKAAKDRKELKERMEKIKAVASKNAEVRAAEIAKEEAEKRANGTRSGEASLCSVDWEAEAENDRQILAAMTPRLRNLGDAETDEEDEEVRAGDHDELTGEARKDLERATGLSPRRSAKQSELEQNIVYDIFDKSDKVAKAKEVKAIDRGTNALATENFDDKEGYLTFQMGELFFDRYEVKRVLGKGVFSTVLGAEDTKYPKDQTKDKKPVSVAIKIIRNNDMMAKCGAKELEFLKLLAKDGGAEKHHIVQLSDDFVHHGHMCLVFEPMAMNLREVIKKFGHNRGINIEGVQVFSKQMFQGLKHLRKCKIVHADIKPDNILINERHNAIKICDFGSGSYINECDITPYLVSRWYRAPEITLCLRYDYSIDLWSIACCMYELYTGKVMFPGNSNNDMLRRFMETKGRFPNKQIKRSMQKMIELGRPVDFTEDFKFMRIMIDKITKKETVKILTIDEKPVKDLFKQLMPTQLQPDQARKVKQLSDLLHHALSLNPDNRFSIEECLHHTFIKEPFGYVPKRREQQAPIVAVAT